MHTTFCLGLNSRVVFQDIICVGLVVFCDLVVVLLRITHYTNCCAFFLPPRPELIVWHCLILHCTPEAVFAPIFAIIILIPCFYFVIIIIIIAAISLYLRIVMTLLK